MGLVNFNNITLIKKMPHSTPRKLQWKKEEIVTSFTDEDAAQLVESQNHTEFAKSLINKFKNQPLTSNQLFWLHKLALQTQTTSQSIEISGTLQAVTIMLEKASAKLQKPSIRIMGEGKQELKLYPGFSEKYKGWIFIYADNKINCLGSIDPTGIFRHQKDCPNWVILALQKFADNPHQAAQEYGTLTGRCCFCYQRLSTETSLSLGYGPICARNYGLLK